MAARSVVKVLIDSLTRGGRWLRAKLEALDLHDGPPAAVIAAWREARGDEVLRLDYPLDRTSVVIDVGGYKGQWASDIHSRYRCKVHVFEPVQPFLEYLVWRFQPNPDVSVHGVGLGNADIKVNFAISDDATSRYRRANETRPATLVAAGPYLTSLEVEQVDLMKINIEGGEYELLEHLHQVGFLPRIAAIQVQFHDIFPDARQRLQRTRRLLSETHAPIYQYDFVWESWQRKPG